MWRRQLLGFIPLLLLSVFLLAPASGQLDLAYNVNWDSVPAETAGKNLTANCICDLVAFSCDPDCCCDSFCPEAARNVSKIAGTCLPEGPPDQTLDFCVPDSYMKKVRGCGHHASPSCAANALPAPNTLMPRRR